MPDWMLLALERYGTDLATITAGAAGGFIRTMRFKNGWRALLGDMAVGAVLAHYLGPVAATIITGPLGIINAQEAGDQLGPFMAGLLGMYLVELVFAVAEHRKRQMDEHSSE